MLTPGKQTDKWEGITVEFIAFGIGILALLLMLFVASPAIGRALQDRLSSNAKELEKQLADEKSKRLAAERQRDTLGRALLSAECRVNAAMHDQQLDSDTRLILQAAVHDAQDAIPPYSPLRQEPVRLELGES